MSSADTEPEAEAAPVDEVREQMLAILRDALGDAIVGSHTEKGDLWVRVRADAWHDAVEAVKTKLACDYFCFLSGIDWMPATAPNPEAAEDDAPAPESATIETGYAGGDTRFQVFARLYSTTRHWGVTLKADLDDAAPAVASITDLYAGADWHEREAWEMYGFDFPGHPRLRHLLLPQGFEGHPLRKDFPLLAREVKPWPGLVDVEPMPGSDDEGEGGEA